MRRTLNLPKTTAEMKQSIYFCFRLLSYKEFIAIMKDRLHRGFKVSNFGLEYNEELTDEYDDGLLAFSMFMKSRACRRLRRQFKILQY